MIARGAREIRGVHSLRKRAGPRSRAQVVAELAYLEHERAKLERESDLWCGNHEKAQVKLRLAHDRMDSLRSMLDEQVSRGSSRPAHGRPLGHRDAASKWREMTLEY
jgi:hypothetical protein